MDPRVAALLARCGRWARLSVLASALVACAAEPQPPAGPPLGVRVAPLSLSGLVDASYALTVRNSANEVVWTRAGLRSTAYGDGSGSLSYVGTCDAAASPNSVEVVVEGLYDAGGLVPAATWMNPTPVSLSVPCLADQDNAVDFDLTVVRAAQQGFFDVSVEFDDLFCSAKLDCQKGPGQPLELLFDPATGRRGQTAVVAFACTAGAGQETTLYLDDVLVTCPGPTVYTVDPSGGPGNITAAPPALFAAAVYRGAELFAGFEKTYWNTALGLNVAALGPNCRLTTTATASEEPFPNLTTPAVAAWPVIRWDVALTNGAGALACTTHPVNGGNGVATSYVPSGAEATHTFAHAASHAGDILSFAPVVASLSPTSGTTGTSVTAEGQGFGATTGSVTLGGVTMTVTSWTSTSVTFTVPTGATSGVVRVIRSDGAAATGPTFEVTGEGAPRITGLSPTAGIVGDTVTITGLGFGATAGGVTLGGVAATVGTWSETSITFTVPAGATSGLVNVSLAAGTVLPGPMFTLTGSTAPALGALSPTSGTTGDSVTLAGVHLGGTAGTVSLGGVAATVTAWGDTGLTFTVPAGSGSGAVVVTTAGGTPLTGPWFTHTGIVPATTVQLSAAATSVWDIDFDAVGNSYYAQFVSGQDKIIKVAPDGTVTQLLGASDWNLGYVASTPDGSVIVGTYAGGNYRVGVVNASNQIAPVYTTVSAGSSGLSADGYFITGPTDPEWGYDGYFYFGNGVAKGDVSRFTATQAPTQVALLPASTPAAYVVSVATLPTGELWAASDRFVYAVNRTTGATTLVGTFATRVRSMAASLHHQRLFVEIVGGTLVELNPTTGSTTTRATGLAGEGFLTMGPDLKLYRSRGTVDSNPLPAVPLITSYEL